MGEFDYPALIVLSQRKQVMARMVGAFEKRPIETFLKRLALGQESITRYEKEALEKVAEVAAGTHHTVLRLAGGELRAFGWNAYGQLGTEEAGSSVPVVVALPAAAAP